MGMKKVILLFSAVSFLFVAFIAIDKTEKAHKILKGVTDYESAQKFYKKSKKKYNAHLYEIRSYRDTLEIDKQLIKLKKGDFFNSLSKMHEKEAFYKIVACDSITINRVSYIYLDGNSYTVTQIDSIRKIILKKLDEGESFKNLHKKYSMDGNPSDDLGWFTDGIKRAMFTQLIFQTTNGTTFAKKLTIANVPNSQQ